MALICVLLLDVRAPLAAGFWLSFIAVAVLLGLVDAESAVTVRLHAGVWLALRTQLAIMLALAPAGLAIFGGLSLQGLVVNLIAIPVISLLFVPVVLAGAVAAWLAPGVDAPCFALAAALYEWLWPGLVAGADLAGLWRVSPPAWWFGLAVPASLVCLCRWPWGLRLTACCAALPLWLPPSRAPPAGSAIVQLLDVGSGSLVLIRTASHVLMFDTGDAWNTRGSRLIEQGMPALDAAGVTGRGSPGAAGAQRRPGACGGVAGAGTGNAAIVGWRWLARKWIADRSLQRCSLGLGWRVHERATPSVATACCEISVPGILAAAHRGPRCPGGARTAGARGARRTAPATCVLMGRQVGEAGSSPEWIENTAPGLAMASGGVDGAISRQRVIERWRRSGSRILDTRRDGGIELELTARGIGTRTVVGSRYPFPWRRVSAALQRPPV